MKMKGRMMLLLTLIVAVALSAISYKGIGSKKALSVHRIEQGLDLSGGVDIVYEADQKSVTDDEMKAAISLLQGRLDWKGWTEAEVAREGDKRIRVQIPGVEDAEEAIQEIGQTAQLSFADEDGNVLLTGDGKGCNQAGWFHKQKTALSALCCTGVQQRGDGEICRGNLEQYW